MTRRDKRIAQMRAHQTKVRYAALEAILRGHGFVSRQRGMSHVMFAHPELDYILPRQGLLASGNTWIRPLSSIVRTRQGRWGLMNGRDNNSGGA